MAATFAPWGLRPAEHPSGQSRARRYPLTTAGSSVNLYKGTPVVLNTAGYITAAAASAADWLGVFAGCEYIDATGKPTTSEYWPGGQTLLAGTQAWGWVYDDPLEIFEIQLDGTAANAANSFASLGDQLNFNTASTVVAGVTCGVSDGSTATGLSTCSAVGTLVGAGVQGMARIIEFAQYPDNTVGDTANTYPVVRVQNARHQYVAVKVAI